MLLFDYLKPVGYTRVLTPLLILFLCTCGRAQDIRLSVIVPNPPPAAWEAYLEFDAEIRVIVTNVGTIPHDLKLVPTLTSDRGLRAAFQPDYQPLSPLTVGPGETVSLTYRDLRTLFGTPTESDFLLEGINFDRLFESETIPEGSYTLCVEARDFATSEALSNNFGCAVFFVRQHEPPLIISPYDGEVVTALQPQFLNFLWSVTGLPGRTRYRFALYDQEELGLFNAADAFLLENVRPYFEADDLVASNLAYDLALPPLTPGHRYAVQVTAYDPEGELLFAQGGRSAVHQFTYRDPRIRVVTDGVTLTGGETQTTTGTQTGGPGSFDTGGPDVQLAMTPCPVLDDPDDSPFPTALSSGQTVTIGQYEMVLNNGGAQPLAGTGRILIGNLNAYVNVSFTGLRVNTSMQVYGNSAVITATAAGNPNLDNLTETTARQLADAVGTNGAWLDGQTGAPLNLPLGLAGAGMDLIITGMNFTPGGATADLFAKIELPETQNGNCLLLIGQGACLNDDNPGQDMDLLLANDQSFLLAPGVDMTFAGGADGTRLRWNADGIDRLDVDFTLDFAPAMMVGGEAFSARVTAGVEDYNNWMGAVTTGSTAADPPPVNLTINYETIEWTYDHSALQNPSGMTLPPTHQDHGPQANLWQGLYLAEFEVVFPAGFDVTIAAENLILDQSGVWTNIDLQGNLVDINDGEIGGWALGIDGLQLDIRESSFHTALFDGRLRLPVADNEVAFTAASLNGDNFSLSLDAGQQLDLNMFFAEAELASDCSVGFERVGNSFRPTATLNGGMSLGWGEGQNGGNNSVPSFDLPGLNFQDFEIIGGAGAPQLSGTFSLDVEGMDQGVLANFPLVFTDHPALSVEGDAASLRLPLGLKLTEIANGFDAGTTFTLVSEWNAGQKRFNYDRTELNALSVDAEMGVLTVVGSIEMYNDAPDAEPNFGDGFEGKINATLNHFDVGLEMQLLVGKMPHYRYFMIDALARFPGVPLGPTGLGLFGLGGGFYYNMDRDFNPDAILTLNDIKLPEPAPGDANGISLLPTTRGQSASPGVRYFPARDTLGFNAKAVLGILPTTKAFNADLEFGMELTTSFSFTEMWMSGQAYVMHGMDSRDGDALITGTVVLNIQPQEPRFQLVSALQSNVYNLLQVEATLDILASPDQWHVYLGKWTEPDNPANYLYSSDPGRNVIGGGFDFGFASVTTGTYSYFMMGNDLHAGLPPKPAEIVNIFNEKPGNLPSGGLGQNLTTGFAFGMVNDFDLSFNARIFRLSARYYMGFDVILADLSQQQCDLDEFGINNWYANGRAYAYLAVEGAVEGRLFRKKRSFKFAELEAAADMQFKGPKPTWLKGRAAISGQALGGLIKFDTQVSFEFGKEVECSGGSGNIFDDIPIVEDFDPVDGAKEQSVFADPTITFNFPKGVFPIEETDDDGHQVTTYYSYKIVSFGVQVKPPGEPWQPYVGDIIGANYDEEGRSCRYDLREQIPNDSKVKMTIIVVGRRHGSNNPGDVAETFTEQPYHSFFEVGKAPDYILDNSIDLARPFHLQRHFFRQSPGEGSWNFWTDRISNDIFRDKPNADDDLDPAGTFRYRVRYTNLGTGDRRNVVPTRLDHKAGGGVDFPIPNNWLVPEQIYSIDLIRIYLPPAGNDIADNTRVEMTNLTEGQDDPLTGGNGTLVFQMYNIDPGTIQPGGTVNSGLMMNNQQFNLRGGGIQTTAMIAFGGGQTFGVDDPGDGPDPGGPLTPPLTLAGDNGDDDFDPTGPTAFLEPGGTLEGIEYEARKVKVRGRITEAVEFSLLQTTIKFRTSKYDTKEEKAATFGIKAISGMDYPTLDYYVHPESSGGNPEGIYLEAPVFFLSCGEPLDRFESTNWTFNFVVTHKNNSSESNAVTFYPSFSFGGDQDNWLFDRFSGENYQAGMRRRPFNALDAWCDEAFPDPDGENITPSDVSLSSYDVQNPPLHTEAANGTPARYVFEPYVLAANDEYSETNSRRYGNPIWVSKRQNRRLPTTQHPGGGNYQYPTVEFFRFNNQFHVPRWASGVPFKVQNTNTELTQTEIGNAASGQEGSGMTIGSDELQLVPTGNGFIPVVDFSEFVAASDYRNYRRLIYKGTTYLAEFSETADNPALDHLYNADNDPECDDPPGPIPGHPGFNDQTANYNYWYQYDKPIRAWLKDFFPYPSRDDQEQLHFSIEGRPLNVILPKLND